MSVSAVPVLMVGELLWDRFPHKEVLGGAPANVAFRVHEQGCGVALCSRVGVDALGDEALRVLTQKGLDVRFIQRDPVLPTGVVDVLMDVQGDAHYTIRQHVAYDALETPLDILNVAGQASVVCFGTLIQRAEVSAHAVARLVEAAHKAEVWVDVNLRTDCYTQESVFRSLAWADVAKLNGDEATLLASWFGWQGLSMQALCAALRERFGLKTCVITLGAQGGVACGADAAQAFWKAPPVQVVDTVGAGDAFTAGCMVAMLRGASLQEACDAGAVLGSKVAGTAGGMTPVVHSDVL
jgi:fructokinase